ncbi:MAG TPA: thiopeptide-type bacteriocin biosynthesis protein [Ktedonobacteraceae bacterium]|nr:thiopeptide-type bacteriocin biosynthesis protein [Ktedonobacteraceae bacterium]
MDELLQVNPSDTQPILVARGTEDHPDITWLYVRIFCQTDENDDVLLRLVAPLEQSLSRQGLIRSFFFIRYAEGGPHVRARFLGPKSLLFDAAREKINRQIVTYFRERGFTLEQPLDPGPYGSDDMVWRPLLDEKTLRPIPSYEYGRYEPELERYGGPHGLYVSEDHFAQSSKIVFQVLALEKEGRGSRRNAAFLLLDAITETFHFSARQKTSYFEQQYRHWTKASWYTLNYHTRLIEAYEKQKSALQLLVPPPGSPATHKSRIVWLPILEQWSEATSDIYNDLMTLWKQGQLTTHPAEIMSSYIHMFCNRLGLFPREEAYLSYLLYCNYTEQLGGNVLDPFSEQKRP